MPGCSRRRIVELGLLVVFAMLAAGCTALAPGGADDKPTIVPWRQIGSVAIGAPARAVRATYRDVLAAQTLASPATGQVGRKEWYRAQEGTLVGLYVNGRVRAVETANERYRGPGNLRVGAELLTICRHLPVARSVGRYRDSRRCGMASAARAG